jgi:hypothetical protein
MADDETLKLASVKVAALLDAAAPHVERLGLEARLASVRAVRAERASSVRLTRRLLSMASVLVVIAIGIVVIRARFVPAAMSFSIAGARAQAGAWVSAGSESVPINFSEGSRLEVHPLGHARIISVDGHGAAVLLERGTLTASVVHRERTAWTVLAGPFEVHVVGTRFDATWDPGTETLVIALAEGRVEVTGPCLRDAHGVSAGETVQISCRDVIANVALSASAAPVAIATPSSIPEIALAPSATASVAAPSPTGEASAAAASARSWRELARGGDYIGAFDEAARRGIDDLIRTGTSDELGALADAARLSHHGDVAERVYKAVRDRFAGSDGAATAAFELGRMTFSRPAEAERWFETYLAERPNGAFEAEASGRLLELADKSGELERARTLAASYLARHPNGAHAALARAVLAR